MSSSEKFRSRLGLQVLDCPVESFDAVAKQTEACIAALAQQPANAPRRVVVVDDETSLITPSFVPAVAPISANRAPSRLSVISRDVLTFGQEVGSTAHLPQLGSLRLALEAVERIKLLQAGDENGVLSPAHELTLSDADVSADGAKRNALHHQVCGTLSPVVPGNDQGRHLHTGGRVGPCLYGGTLSEADQASPALPYGSAL